MSRNVPVSLPSRNATSGSTSSPEASAFAFFAIRCESTDELVRELELAQAAAALADLLRGLLRQLEDRVVALVDAVQALGERRQALLVVEQPAGRDVDPLPARLDAVQQLDDASVLRDGERRARVRRRRSGTHPGSRRTARGCP